MKSFNENSDKQFIKKIKKYENQKLIGYIIDLRNNPGGLLNQAVAITDFLEKGEIVSTKGRKISETRKFFARTGDGIKGKPIIVLINGDQLQRQRFLPERSKTTKELSFLEKALMEKDLCNQLYLFGMEGVSDLQSQNIIYLRVNQSQKLGCHLI